MNSIQAIMYVNLDFRPDRKLSIENEITKIGFDKSIVHRISAIYNKDCGHIGCGLSHIDALNLAIQNNWKRVIIFEDDFHFNMSTQQFDSLIKEADTLAWDVLLLAKGHFDLQEKKGILQKVNACSTASGYIIQKHYLEKLRNNFLESIQLMEKQLIKHKQHYSEPYATIGKEYETIHISTKRLRYGHPEKGWLEKNVYINEFIASNEFFEGDPAPGKQKIVQIQNPDTFEFVTIGKESETISVPNYTIPQIPNGYKIRYGIPNSEWVEKTVFTNMFHATNEFFGKDPAPGKQKIVQIYTPYKITNIPKFIHGVAAIDQHWGILQKLDNFYISDPVAGFQGGYGSDTF